MKNRSHHHHRLPPSAPPDDWGDGSWTVDCSCGVTFDDGDEMVSCDECGVWVHTRCSRFVRGDTSFACHNCTAASSDDAAETEVARLLAELPTKAPDPRPPHPLPPQPPPVPHFPHRRPFFRVPVEERVHVQGIPGGDPALFQGISPAFTPNLWRCAGYVPKKFNFQYREFPCLDELDESPACRGADVLFSLSKENGSFAPAVASVKKGGGLSMGSVKKERSRLHVFRAQKEGKRKARRETDLARMKKGGSLPIFNMRKAGFCEDGGLRVVESDNPSVKSEEMKEEMPSELNSIDGGGKLEIGNKSKRILVLKTSRVGLPDEDLRKTSSEAVIEVEKVDFTEPAISCKLDVFRTSREEASVGAKEPVLEEDFGKAVHGPEQFKHENHFEGHPTGTSNNVAILSEIPNPVTDDLGIIPDEVATPMIPQTNAVISLASNVEETEAKLQDNHEKSNETKLTNHSEKLHEHERESSLSSSEQKTQHVDRDKRSRHQTCDKIEEVKDSRFGELTQHGQLVEIAGSSLLQRDPSDLGRDSEGVDETKNTCSSDPSPPTSEVNNFFAGLPKLSSSPSKPSLPRSSVNHNAINTTCLKAEKATHLTKKRRLKTVEHVEEGTQDVSRQRVEDQRDSFEWPQSKSSHTGRASSASKDSTPSLKGRVNSSSSKSSALENATILSSSGEASGSSQTQKDSGEVKQNEKTSKPVQSSSRPLMGSMVVHPPPPLNATARDEEYALLLHQQLNSSPRVPKVPRMHMAVPTAASILKRSSSSKKEQVSVFRRKGKEDASQGSSRNSREFIEEPKRNGRTLSSPELKHKESGSFTDVLTKRDSWNRSPSTVISLRKNSMTPGNGANDNPSSFENNDDDATLNCRSLPGLINEILSKSKGKGKGKCSTYDEICDAVQLHWHNLRKPNGERYAYSSHSLAVFDCLRNRSEWAHLIDRVPKTNSIKKRRKSDSEVPVVESESEEYRSKESHRPDDFPKRKRNARKRSKTSKLEKQSNGRDANSDEDPTAFSPSSNDLTAAEGNSLVVEAEGEETSSFLPL